MILPKGSELDALLIADGGGDGDCAARKDKSAILDESDRGGFPIDLPEGERFGDAVHPVPDLVGHRVKREAINPDFRVGDLDSRHGGVVENVGIARQKISDVHIRSHCHAFFFNGFVAGIQILTRAGPIRQIGAPPLFHFLRVRLLSDPKSEVGVVRPG